MSIRTLIKTSNFAQLLLLLLLGACLVAFGRGLNASRTVLEDFYRLELLLVEIDTCASQMYTEAHAFVLTGNPARYENWERLSGEERGELPRAGTSRVAPGRKASLAELADGINASEPIAGQVRTLINQCAQLDKMMHKAVLIARGNSGPPHWDRDGLDLEGAQRWAAKVNLEYEAVLVATGASALRDSLYHKFLDRVADLKAPLVYLLWGMVAALLALAASAVANICIFQRRVAGPLGQVSQYAEGVAAGEDPAPLRLRHRDELAVMFASLQRMKGTLFTRIRELKEAERTARKSKQQAVLARTQALTSLELAQRASHVQDDFLRRISHEIRTPLNAIIGMSYLALQTSLSGGQRDYLSQINKSGSVLLDMVNRILDFSSVSEGSLSMEQRVFLLPRLLELLRQSVAGSALEKKLELKFLLDPAVPMKVVGDERHLEEVLRILLDNAVKYTVSGKVECSVLPAPEASGQGVRLLFVVADTGPGLDDEQRNKLFEPFALGDESMTRASSGLGLGLALARQLVNLMGGELSVASAPGQGSRFFFELSFENVQQTSAQAATPQYEADIPEDGKLNRTVLVVDDNEINAQISRELLVQAGLEVRLAANGLEAVEVVRDGGIGLVIMDVQMPIMDGLAATTRIREMGFTPEELPIIAMTAHTDAASRLDGRNVGMNDYLTKPVDPAALYAALEKWLPAGLESNPLRDEERKQKATSGDAGCLSLEIMRETVAASSSRDGAAVNVEAGLATVGGNRKLYQELLLRFVDHYGGSPGELRALLAAGDFRGAARLAHTVKGVAANLGVERVCRLTRSMEDSLPETPPSEELMDAFEKSMEEVLLRVRCLEGEGDAAEIGTLHLESEYRESLLALLEELPGLMETDWGSAESALEHFVPLVNGTPYAQDLEAILGAVKDFDNEGMRAHVAEMRRKLQSLAV